MHLTLKPTTAATDSSLKAAVLSILEVLRLEMPRLGVKDNDIVFVTDTYNGGYSSEEHVVGLLITDNPHLTAQAVVNAIDAVVNFRFEISRISVGNGDEELYFENIARRDGTRRNWASNYEESE